MSSESGLRFLAAGADFVDLLLLVPGAAAAAAEEEEEEEDEDDEAEVGFDEEGLDSAGDVAGDFAADREALGGALDFFADDDDDDDDDGVEGLCTTDILGLAGLFDDADFDGDFDDDFDDDDDAVDGFLEFLGVVGLLVVAFGKGLASAGD